jgi:hypothetical protein
LRSGHFIRLRATCFQKAGEICAAGGYTVLARSDESGLAALVSRYGGFANTANNRMMIIRCNEGGVPAAEALGEPGWPISARRVTASSEFFISYSRKDEDFAQELLAGLQLAWVSSPISTSTTLPLLPLISVLMWFLPRHFTLRIARFPSDSSDTTLPGSYQIILSDSCNVWRSGYSF